MNNYVQAYVIVEGPTELLFVRDILAPYLGSLSISLSPIRIGKPGHKGGNISLARAKIDIGNLLKQQADTLITTMFDYYGLSGEWPGRSLSENERLTLSAGQKAQRVEQGLLDVIQQEHPDINIAGRFIPFFVMHEFEALLFSSPTILAKKLAISEEAVQRILEECDGPEEINDSANTAPSKRLANLLSGHYRKTTQGIAIASEIGLSQIRRECSHFDHWLQRLERMGPES